MLADLRRRMLQCGSVPVLSHPADAAAREHETTARDRLHVGGRDASANGEPTKLIFIVTLPFGPSAVM